MTDIRYFRSAGWLGHSFKQCLARTPAPVRTAALVRMQPRICRKASSRYTATEPQLRRRPDAEVRCFGRDGLSQIDIVETFSYYL